MELFERLELEGLKVVKNKSKNDNVQDYTISDSYGNDILMNIGFEIITVIDDNGNEWIYYEYEYDLLVNDILKYFEFVGDLVYALYFYMDNGMAYQLKASYHVDDLVRKKKRMEEKSMSEIWRIKPIKELRKEQAALENIREDMENEGFAKEDIDTILFTFAKYDNAFKKLIDE